MEIEIKAYCDSPDSVISRLNELGGCYIGRRDERDVYFNHPSRDFKNTDEALRLRQTGDKCLITYKGPKLSANTKTRIEHETVIGDYNSARNILAALGFIESGIVEKTRTLYRLGEMEVCLDEVDGVGMFVELEIIGELADGIETRLFDTASRLGLSRFERRSYLELKYFS